MKKLTLALLLGLLLLAGYIWLDSPLEDKTYGNPIGEQVEALEFWLADGSGSVRLEDPDAIALLRRVYRWTNYHMYCCLGHSKVYAYVSPVIGGSTDQVEAMRIYRDWQTPGFNLSFRLLLRKYCDDLLCR